MDNYEIKNILSQELIKCLIENKKFDLDLISNNLKLDIVAVKSLFPGSSDINTLELLKIFNSNIDDEILIIINKEIKDEDASYFEKILESLFIKFENLSKYKKAFVKLSSSFNNRFINFVYLNQQNHQFMIKLMICCGDEENFFKLNVKACILNAIYLKNLKVFLSEDNINLETVMRRLDNDLKKSFELKFLFKNF